MKAVQESTTMDDSTALQSCQGIIPKLKKNRRVESQWGAQYHMAVRDAVFGTYTVPHVPSEPPSSLSEDADEAEPLYVCKECRDSFRFLDSFEEHNSRRSWVLGYWCNYCFQTNCTHMPCESAPCSKCIKLDQDKRAYLKAKGIVKTQKLGIIKVFYNQCQFFAHMKQHGISTVDIGDIMLMPLPSSLEVDWYPELDVAFEALMEHAFLVRVHILDWLEVKNLNDDWWRVIIDKKQSNNIVLEIVQSYREGRKLFKIEPITEKSSEKSSENSKKSQTRSNTEIVGIPVNDTSKDKNSVNTANATIISSGKNERKNGDNPCTTDIAFVDCGPASQCFEAEPPTDSSQEKPTAPVTSNHDSSSSMQTTTYNIATVSLAYSPISSKASTPTSNKELIKLQPITNLTTQFNKDIVGENVPIENNLIKTKPETKVIQTTLIPVQSDNLLSKPPQPTTPVPIQPAVSTPTQPAASTSTQLTPIINSNSALVTLKSGKTIDVVKLLPQLPSHVIAGGRLVILEQSQDKVTKQNKQEATVIQVNPLSNDINNAKTITKVIPLHTATETAATSVKKPQSNIKPQLQQHPLDGKILYQNGKKYIIKQSSNPPKNMLNVLTVPAVAKPPQCNQNVILEQNVTTTKTNSSDDSGSTISPLTLSPSSSELSNTSVSESGPKPSPMEVVDEQQNKNSISTVNNIPMIAIPSDMLSFYTTADGKSILNIEFKQTSSKKDADTRVSMAKYRQDLINEFFQLRYLQLKRRIDHIEYINREVSSVTKFLMDSTVRSNFQTVNIFHRILKERLARCSAEDTVDPEYDPVLDDWETRYLESGDLSTCIACKRLVKPKCYILSFSKSAKDDNMYCTCFKYVCHECRTYQGSLSRFLAHQNYHIKKRPFACPDCFRNFASFTSLEAHTWSSCFHLLRRQFFGCEICEIDGFQDMESITRHFAVMHSSVQITCNKCNTVSATYSDYMKHVDDVHPSVVDDNPTRLVYCKLGQCVVRPENYFLHLEKHLCVKKSRWFKCSLCSFISPGSKQIGMILKSHMQNKHLHSLHTIISKEALWEILPPHLLKKLHWNVATPPEIYTGNTVLPKIIFTESITSEVFERGQGTTEVPANVIVTSEENKEKSNGLIFHSSRLQNINQTIVNVYSFPELNTTSVLPKILDVRSIAQSSSDSPPKTTADTLPSSENSLTDTNVSTDKKESTVVNSESTENTRDAKTPMKGGLSVVDIRKLRKADITEEPVALIQSCNYTQEQKSSEEVQILPLLLKPPPLARIPRHILQTSDDSNGGTAYQEIEDETSLSEESLETYKRRYRTSLRIALNEPKDSKQSWNYKCHVCNELINTSWPVINQHFTAKHRNYKLSVITPRLIRISPEFINGGYKEYLKKRKLDTAAVSTSKRKRRSLKKYVDSSTPGLGLCVQQETAKDGAGNFKCKKCDQTCRDMSNLREHIASNHRIKGTYLICLECGENFVVASSLQMHLKAFHGIEDSVAYMSENRLCAPDIIDDTEGETKTVVANECHVCKAVFEDRTDLVKHFRVHGMAFLNQNKTETESLVNSPDERTKTEEEVLIVDSCKDSPKETVTWDNLETLLDKNVSDTF